MYVKNSMFGKYILKKSGGFHLQNIALPWRLQFLWNMLQVGFFTCSFYLRNLNFQNVEKYIPIVAKRFLLLTFWKCAA